MGEGIAETAETLLKLAKELGLGKFEVAGLLIAFAIFVKLDTILTHRREMKALELNNQIEIEKLRAKLQKKIEQKTRRLEAGGRR